jgi:outer membrane protein TolC
MSATPASRLALARAACALVMLAPAVAHADVDRSMSLAEVLRIALQHNGDLYLSQNDAAIANDELELARSAFVPRFQSEARLSRERQAGSATSFAWTDASVQGSIELFGRAPTGLAYSLRFGAARQHHADPFATVFSPANTTSLTLSVTQPLLRGAWAAARLPIDVADLRRAATNEQLRVRLEQVLGQVEVAYWTLALAHREQQARASSLKVAEEQLADSTRLARLGTISNLDVVEARAGVSRRQQDLIRSKQDLAVAESGLIALMQEPSSRDAIVPADSAEVVVAPSSIDEHMEIARRSRPDLVAAAALVKAEEAALQLARNELLPALDVVASFGAVGFSGTLQRNYATAGVVDGTLDPPYALAGDVDGGVSRSLANLATGGEYIVSVGLKLELPISARGPRSRHDRQRHVLERARLVEQSLVTNVRNELRRSLELLNGDAEQVKIADELVAHNQKLLIGMRKQFTLGGITSFDVLRVADELTRAQIDAARTRANYRISLARLAAARGTLLQHHRIDVSALRVSP